MRPKTESAATPEEISTGPVLNWTEFDPDEVFGPDIAVINRIDSVGDGRVLASVFDLDGTSRVIVTKNGSDWNEIPLPAGIAPWQIDITGHPLASHRVGHIQPGIRQPGFLFRR